VGLEASGTWRWGLSRQARPIEKGIRGVWHLAARVPARRPGSKFCLVAQEQHHVILQSQKLCFDCCGHAWSTKLWWYLEGRLAGVPWVVAQNVSIELWLGIEVKHVAFLELWLRDISWVMVRDGGWTQGTLELWLGLASVASVSVRVVARTDGSRYIAHLSMWLTSLIVLGHYELCSYWELHLVLHIMVCS